MRVLLAASEAAPLTKTGGLADVPGALPAALRGLDTDVRVLIPGYKEVIGAMEDARTIRRFMDVSWVARALERIGDHAKNIAEYVVYLVHGRDIRHTEREAVLQELEAAKGDRPASA